MQQRAQQGRQSRQHNPLHNTHYILQRSQVQLPPQQQVFHLLGLLLAQHLKYLKRL